MTGPLLIHNDVFAYSIIGRHMGAVHDLLPQELLYLLPPEPGEAPSQTLTRIENTWIHNIANHMLLLEYYISENRQLATSFSLMFRTLEQTLHRYTRLNTTLNNAYSSFLLQGGDAALPFAPALGQPAVLSPAGEATHEPEPEPPTLMIEAPRPADTQVLIHEAAPDDASASAVRTDGAAAQTPAARQTHAADTSAAAPTAQAATMAEDGGAHTILFHSREQRDALVRLVNRLERSYAGARRAGGAPETYDIPAISARSEGETLYIPIKRTQPADIEVLASAPAQEDTQRDAQREAPTHITHAADSIPPQPVIVYRGGEADIRWLTDLRREREPSHEQRPERPQAATVVLPPRYRAQRAEPASTPERDAVDAAQGGIPESGAPFEAAPPPDMTHHTDNTPHDAEIPADTPQAAVVHIDTPVAPADTVVLEAGGQPPHGAHAAPQPHERGDAPASLTTSAQQSGTAQTAARAEPIAVQLAQDSVPPPAAIVTLREQGAIVSDAGHMPAQAATASAHTAAPLTAVPAQMLAYTAGTPAPRGSYHTADVPHADLHYAAARQELQPTASPQAQRDIEFITKHHVSESTVREQHTKTVAVNAPPELMEPMREAAQLQEQAASIHRLTDQVYRRIQQRLNMERQRRGR